MIQILLALLLIAAKSQGILIDFDHKERVFSVVYSDASESQQSKISEALQKGIELEVRFSMMLCKKRELWLDRCSSEGVEEKRIKYDPITQVYKLSVDRINDGEKALTRTLETVDDCLKEINTLESYPLGFLSSDRELTRLLNNSRAYLSVKRQIDFPHPGSALNLLSSIVTFGMLSSSEIDSGWEDFKLTRG